MNNIIYYPPVQICNNSTEVNNHILYRQLTKPKGLVQQNIFRNQQYNIGNSAKKLNNNKMIQLDKKLYLPINNIIQLDSLIHNRNTINNRCGFNPNIQQFPYIYPVNNNVNLCLYPKYTFKPCIKTNSPSNMNQLNQWNIYQKSLHNIPSNNIHHFTNQNTIPFMLNQRSITKPINPNCNLENNNCPSLFNHQTKQKNYYKNNSCK